MKKLLELKAKKAAEEKEKAAKEREMRKEAHERASAEEKAREKASAKAREKRLALDSAAEKHKKIEKSLLLHFGFFSCIYLSIVTKSNIHRCLPMCSSCIMES